jgi:glycosyltransferase involved in cell wall biosynthesis
LRILYFSRDYTTHDRRFLEKLAAPDRRVWYLRLEDDGIPYEKRSLPAGVTPVDWPLESGGVKSPEACLRLVPAFEEVLQDVKPDIVQAGPVQTCGFVAALSGFRPFLLVSWGSDILVEADRSPTMRWVTRYTLARSSMLLCDAEAVRAKAKSLAAYPDERIVQFPWGIDLQLFSPAEDRSGLRQMHGWEGACVVLSTRAWEPIYGIPVLLEAFSRAYEKAPSLRLMLLGSGSLAPEIEKFVSSRGLSRAVVMPGQVAHERLPDVFRCADVYVSCTYSDGTSISLLEALATGLPVVVTDVPGNREWVEEGTNGWLAPPGDSEAFARALVLASARREQVPAMRLANRRLAETKADWNRNFEMLLGAYGRLLEMADVRRD